MIRLEGVLARLRLFFARRAAESRMNEEFRFHIEMETEKNLRTGMSPTEARRRAAVAFGGVEEHKEDMRDGRGLTWLTGMSLDLKLGFRMLAKSPAHHRSTLALAVLGAVIVGVLPALRATGPHLRAALGNLSGGAKAQLGRTWTVLIVTQVAIAVAVLPPAVLKGRALIVQATQQPGFAADEVLAVRIERDGDDVSDTETPSSELAASVRVRQAELTARLASEPGVVGVTFTDVVPGREADARIEIEGAGTSERIRTHRVDASYFDLFDVKVAAGRSFSSGDMALVSNRPVIVNRSFAAELTIGGEVVGRRVRSR